MNLSDLPAHVHPKQAQQQEARVMAALEEQARVEREHNLARKHKLRYVHVRRMAGYVGVDTYAPVPKGGVTVAYQLPARKGSRTITASCALVHDNDCYCKRTGRYFAACKFDKGEHIQLRVPRNMPPSEFLKRMFGEML